MATHQAVYVHAASSGRHLIAKDSNLQCAFISSFGVIGSLTNEVALPDFDSAKFLSPVSLQSS